MRQHITTILPGAAFGAMLVLVVTSLGQVRSDPESRLYARATAFCEAAANGETDRVIAFLDVPLYEHTDDVGYQELRRGVDEGLAGLRGARFAIMSVTTDGDEGEVRVHWRDPPGRTHWNLTGPMIWRRSSGRWYLAP